VTHYLNLERPLAGGLDQELPHASVRVAETSLRFVENQSPVSAACLGARTLLSPLLINARRRAMRSRSFPGFGDTGLVTFCRIGIGPVEIDSAG